MTLVVSGLARHFGGVQAVRDVVTLHPGECVALIGPNGAGKSTTFACIAGQLQPHAGSVVWNGARINALDAPERIRRRGVARTFQVAQVFEALTVLQNLQLLMQIPRGLNAYDDLDRCAKPLAQALLEQVDLAAWGSTLARHLPRCQKRLELAMALAGLQDCGLGVPRQRPDDAQLLLLDEPAAGLASSERQTFERWCMASHAMPQGAPMAVLYTEHNMDAVFGVADRALVLMDGVLVADGTPDAIARDPQVRERYLGHGWNLQEHLMEGRDA